jgi:hypothetical protein
VIGEQAMPGLIVSVNHRLSQDEALRRIPTSSTIYVTVGTVMSGISKYPPGTSRFPERLR